MKIAGAFDKDKEEITLNMVAMIDIVFQLLVFFIMTFKITALEGDFKVRMPLATDKPPEQLMDDVPTLISVKLNSGDNGNITSIDVDDGVESQNLTGEGMYQGLTDFVEKVLAAGTDPANAEDTEVEFDIDYQLKYQYTVKAIGAVSGKILPDDTVKTLIEKIKFRNNSQ